MIAKHPGFKDLYENRPFYEEEAPAADQTLHIRHAFEGVMEEAEDLTKCSGEALAGLLAQFRKDLLFERDPRTKRDLRTEIDRIEAEIENRKEDYWGHVVDKALKPDVATKQSDTRLDADANWQRVTRKAAA